jgi:RHS repeat-associated protein
MWQWQGEAFGHSLPDENPQGAGAFANNLRMPGQYFDAETGLFYNYFRDYDPSVGRYVQSDPIGLAGGVNTYGYVGGNPIGMMDPSGLLAIAGNWCGPNWTGGKEEKFNPAASYGYYDPATGQTDRACQRHDACYQECRQQNCSSDNEKAACFRKCDRQLASEIPFSSRDSVPIGQQSLIWFWMRFNRSQNATD